MHIDDLNKNSLDDFQCEQQLCMITIGHDSAVHFIADDRTDKISPCMYIPFSKGPFALPAVSFYLTVHLSVSKGYPCPSIHPNLSTTIKSRAEKESMDTRIWEKETEKEIQNHQTKLWISAPT